MLSCALRDIECAPAKTHAALVINQLHAVAHLLVDAFVWKPMLVFRCILLLCVFVVQMQAAVVMFCLVLWLL